MMSPVLQHVSCVGFLTALLPVIVVPVTYRPVSVDTPLGTMAGLRGVYEFHLGTDNITDQVDVYLGVRYAAPPIGNLRFEPPQPPRSWRGVVNATSPGYVCPQMDVYHPGTQEQFQDEDCLFLDIYSPYQPSRPDSVYPVMVYIHGGSYEVGSGKLYNGEVLALFGVVVVTINYRLGALGFLTSGNKTLAGNYGLLDQVQALRWVHDNIGSFRGDPNNVTVFGHSAGGASVGLLLTVPSAQGLFHRAIAQSGAATAPYSYHRNGDGFSEYVRRVGVIMGCPYTIIAYIVTCLRQVPAVHFIRKRHLFPLYDPIDPEFRPLVDGDVLPLLPEQAIQQGRFFAVPFVLGTVRDEFANYFNGGARHRPTFDMALDTYVNKFTGYQALLNAVVRYEYTDWKNSKSALPEEAFYDRGSLLTDMHMVAPTARMATLLSSQGVPTFQYHFTTGYSYHSVELNYVFGAPFSGIYADEMNTVMKLNSGQNFSWHDRFYSRLVMKLWTNFAKFGHPTPDKLGVLNTDWTAYDNVNRSYLYLSDEKTQVRHGFRAEKVAFWNLLVPRLKSGMLTERKWHGGGDGDGSGGSDSHNYQTEMWALVGVSVTLLIGILVLLYLLVRTRMKQLAQQARLGARYIDNGRGPTRV